MVVGGLLGTLGGFVQLIITGGANPHVLSTELTLSLLVMVMVVVVVVVVVLGGAGSRWGAIIGGAVYVLLDNWLEELSTSPTVADLPAVLRVPLSQPLFVLGTLFILVVYFAPGGITATGGRVGMWWRRRRAARQSAARGDSRASTG